MGTTRPSQRPINAAEIVGGDDYNDELLDGVVRTVTAQTDTREAGRRRARVLHRKSRKYCVLVRGILVGYKNI